MRKSVEGSAQDFGAYRKTIKAKATLGEARTLAFTATYPALLAARWALAVSCVGLIVASLALWRAW